MAEAGLGRAVLPCILGDASRDLERLSEGPDEMSVPVWVASHVGLADAPRLKSLRNAIAAGLVRHADALSGIR